MSKNIFESKFENVAILNNSISDTDTLIMGLRLNDGLKISKIKDKSIINFCSLKELQNRKIISFKNGILKVNNKHMIKLDSIINFLINT